MKFSIRIFYFMRPMRRILVLNERNYMGTRSASIL